MRAAAVIVLLVAIGCASTPEASNPLSTPPPAPGTPTPVPSAEPTDTGTDPDPSDAASPAPTPPDPADWARLEPRVVTTYPHDPDAFTQGLVLEDGRLFESTGRRGSSTLREVDLESGEVLRSIALDDEYFGEGLELVGDRLILLTWQAQTAFVHDRDTFDLLGAFDYPTEGWGLCHDGGQLVMSDGSSELVFRDPDSFESLGSVTVTLDGQAVNRLNELECVGGDVWANVWLTDTIVRIHPGTGFVTGVVDASALEPDRPDDNNAVLNGIAYDESTGRFLVTGKLWPTLYEVEFVPAGG